MKNIKLLLLAKLLALSAAAQADFQPRQPQPNGGAAQEGAQRAGAFKQYSGRVTSVADGDTLRVTDSHGAKHKIRMAYIDAPELQQAHGKAAQQALERAAEGRNVEIEVFETDRYRREVAKVRLNGKDLNLAQIEQGNAWHYASIAKRKQNKADYAAYAAAEAAAKQSGAGLWRNRQPQAPWNFRRDERERQNPGGGNRSGSWWPW